MMLSAVSSFCVTSRSGTNRNCAQLRLSLSFVLLLLLVIQGVVVVVAFSPSSTTTTTSRANTYYSSQQQIGNFRTPASLYSRLCVSTSPPEIGSSSDSGSVVGTDDDDNNNSKKTKPRPLHQNWWPVTLISSLDKSRPNPIELLDQKLVLWYTGEDDKDKEDETNNWSCLDDACAHRFAPLSEGRVIPENNNNNNNKRRLQCAYHGWEFEGHGGCTRIPQLEQQQSTTTPTHKMARVNSYPVRLAAGMVWVWADPKAKEEEEESVDPYSIPLPISSLMERFDSIGDTNAKGYMRDLPYGYELLGENLVDISHLPFSHHSVGALNRADGRPVPLKMLSQSQRNDLAHKQNSHHDDNNNNSWDVVLPALFQGRVVNATQHDPELVAMLKNPAIQAISNPDLASASVGFFDPCHVRYHRNSGAPRGSYEIQLFMCPKSAGSSRVFLFTPFESQLPPLEQETEEEKEVSLNKKETPPTTAATTKKNNLGPRQKLLQAIRGLVGSIRGVAVQKLVPGGNMVLGRPRKGPAYPPYFGHMIAHSIFDGDGIFLHKQGDRMRRSGLTYRDYNTPTSSDAMVNAFRRWLDSAASVTKNTRAVAAATGGDGGYLDNRSREDMLDRYQSHTANCKLCLTALKELENKKDKLELARIALVGASGASAFLTVATALLSIAPRLRMSSLPAMLASALATIGSIVAAKKTMSTKEALATEIQRFYFVDYVHAEKD